MPQSAYRSDPGTSGASAGGGAWEVPGCVLPAPRPGAGRSVRFPQARLRQSAAGRGRLAPPQVEQGVPPERQKGAVLGKKVSPLPTAAIGRSHGVERFGVGDPAWARTQVAAGVSGAVRRVLGVGRARTRLGRGAPHPCGVADILERRSWDSFAFVGLRDGDATERRARLGRGGGRALAVVDHRAATILVTRSGGGGRGLCVRGGRFRGRCRCSGGWYGPWREAAVPVQWWRNAIFAGMVSPCHFYFI